MMSEGNFIAFAILVIALLLAAFSGMLYAIDEAQAQREENRLKRAHNYELCINKGIEHKICYCLSNSQQGPHSCWEEP